MTKSIDHPNSQSVPSKVTIKETYGGNDPYATNPGAGNPLIKNSQPGEPPAQLPSSPDTNNY